MDSISNSSNVLKAFDLSNDSKDKASIETGKRVAETILSSMVGTMSYYYLRNARFLLNRQIANGTYNAQAEFQDKLGFDGKQNYANLMWITLHTVSTIISKRVSAWMGRNEKIQVKAKDTNSIIKKNEAYKLAEFFLEHRDKVAQMEQASGMPLRPQNTFVPEDKDELDLWAAQFNFLPEEIKCEMGINSIAAESGFFDVIKEKQLHDSAEVGLVAMYTGMNSKGEIYDKYIKPENSFYSYSEYPDFRDAKWKGHNDSLKISDLRKWFGKQFGGKLSEQQIWEIAKYAKNYQLPDKTSFNAVWTSSMYRPYDDCTIEVMFFEIRDLEEQLFPMKVNQKGELVVGNPNEANTVGKMYNNLKPKLSTQKNSSVLKSAISNVLNEQKSKLSSEKSQQLRDIHKTIDKNNDLPQDKLDEHISNCDAILSDIVSASERIVSRDYNIYEGIYAKDAKIMLKWEVKKNQIRPQDPSKICQVDFGYSFYMYQNYDMRNLAIPQKVEEPFKNMCLVRFRIQQLVATAVPSGWVIDETALDSIDYGLANENKKVDHERLFAQTGRLYYRGVDGEGNRVPVPITELRNSGFAEQMNAYIALYAHHYQVLKSELGDDPDIVTQAAQPRVTAENVQTSVQQGDIATDYMYDAYLYVMEQAGRKKACLLNDSVVYGSKVYSHILGEEEVRGREFVAEAKMLPTNQEVAMLVQTMNQAIAANPILSNYLDIFKITRIAKEDVKLAELFYRQTLKRMNKSELQKAQQNAEQTFKGQQESAQAAEAAKRQTMKDEIAMKGDIENMMSKERQKEILMTGIMNMRGKGVDLGGWAAVEQELIRNVGVPLFAENIQNEQSLMDAMEQDEQEPQSQEMPIEQQEQQPIQQ